MFLRILNEAERQAFLALAREYIQADQKVTPQEEELLRVFCLEMGLDPALQLPAPVVFAGLLVMLPTFALCKSFGALIGLGVGLTCVFASRLSRRARWMVLAALVGLAAVAFGAAGEWHLKAT